MVRFPHVNLWCHVTLSSQLCLQSTASILAYNWGCEPKVSNLQIEVLVIQHILRLQISVCDTFLMNIVKSFYDLFEIKSGDSLVESSSCCDIVEQLSTGGKLKNNVNHALLASIALFNNSILVVFYQIHYIGVAELTHCVDFSHN